MGWQLFECLLVLFLLASFLVWQDVRWQEAWAVRVVTQAAQQLQMETQLARQLAMSQQQSVVWCGAAHSSCDGHWADGRLICTASGRLCHHLAAMFSGLQVSWRPGAVGRGARIRFLPPLWRLDSPGHFAVSWQHVTAWLVVSSAGRARIQFMSAR